jgi:hypothetical protein
MNACMDWEPPHQRKDDAPDNLCIYQCAPEQVAHVQSAPSQQRLVTGFVSIVRSMTSLLQPLAVCTVT